MELNELSPIVGSKKKRKRVGRGPGSGRGKTATRGQKGQQSRTSGGVPARFEGGQMPMHMRLPKRGFHNPFGKDYAEVNVRDLSRFEAGSVVDQAALREAGLVKQVRDGVKLLGCGEIDRALTLRVSRVTAGAKAKIEAAGGTVELV
jgi:large subunit ribosomal protein L15